MKKQKLKKILSILAPDETFVDFKAFDEQVNTLKENLKKKIQVATLDDVSSELEKFKKLVNLSPLQETLKSIESKLNSDLETKSLQLEELLSSKMDASQTDSIAHEISDLQRQINSLSKEREDFSKTIEQKHTEIGTLQSKANKSISDLSEKLSLYMSLQSASELEESKRLRKEIQDGIDALRKDLMTRIGNIGGGSMNRQMFIGGVDPLTRYTDVNFKAGSNVTLSYANNDTTKKVDITISATGGSGSGIVRSINSVSTPTTAGSASTTDYVYLVSGTTTITLPTAVGNTNLYTIKNVGTNTVTVNTTSAQTIDGSATITLPVQYTAVDIESDNSNWNIT